MEFKKIFISDKTHIIKKEAKLTISGKWTKLILSTLPLSMLVSIAPIIIGLVQTHETSQYPVLYPFYLIIIIVILPLLIYGMCNIVLQNAIGANFSYTCIFSGFKFYGKSLWMILRISFELMMSSLPMILAFIYAGHYILNDSPINFTPGNIVVGIIAVIACLALGLAMPAYTWIRYSQAFFLMIDMQLSVNAALHNSIKLMKWNEKKMLYLLLSFIGWMSIIGLLCGSIITCIVLVDNLILLIIVITFGFIIQSIVTGTLIVYISSTLAVFYEKLVSRMIQDDSVSYYDETIVLRD
jgi:uncharacterized membrane protein